MNWIEQVTILDLLVKGFIVGVVVSAPLGPVGVLCIQRTLNKGRWFGFVTGLGAALSDICYALITGYGMSFMDELILKHQIFLQIVGSIMLLAFGIYTFRSNPVKSLRPAAGERARLFVPVLFRAARGCGLSDRYFPGQHVQYGRYRQSVLHLPGGL